MCLKRLEAGASLGDGIKDVEKVPGRAHQPVEPRHHQYVTGFEPADRLGQLWPIGPSARSFLLEDIAAVSLLSGL